MLQLLDDPFGDLVESGPRAAAATVAGESVMPVVPFGPVMRSGRARRRPSELSAGMMAVPGV
jgi:hypothetical protein